MNVAAGRALPRLAVVLRPSRWLALVLAAGHVAAIVVACISIPDSYFAIPAACVLAWHAAVTITHHALLQSKRAVVALDIRGANECTALRRDGLEFVCRIGADSYIATWLTILQLERSERRLRRYVVIAPDSGAADALRRLRVRLRWGAAAGKRRDDGDTWL